MEDGNSHDSDEDDQELDDDDDFDKTFDNIDLKNTKKYTIDFFGVLQPVPTNRNSAT